MEEPPATEEEDQRIQSDLEAGSRGGGREPGELNAADTDDFQAIGDMD